MSYDREKLNRLIAGHREIVSDAFLDAVAATDYGSEIRTANNRHRCGILDAYVAWIGDDNRPSDLTCETSASGQLTAFASL